MSDVETFKVGDEVYITAFSSAPEGIYRIIDIPTDNIYHVESQSTGSAILYELTGEYFVKISRSNNLTPGDQVIITGRLDYRGKSGVIIETNDDKCIVQVKDHLISTYKTFHKGWLLKDLSSPMRGKAKDVLLPSTPSDPQLSLF